MTDSRIIRGVAAAVMVALLSTLSLVGLSAVGHARDRDEVKTFKLRTGEVRITNFADDDKLATVSVEGKEFAYSGGYATLYRKFQLKDRDILIISVDPMGSAVWPEYWIIAVPLRGEANEVKDPDFSNPDSTFEVRQQGESIKFNLGYDEGFKKDAILSAAGLTISKKRVARPAFTRQDCEWLYEDALDNCVKNIEGFQPCEDVFHPTSTRHLLNRLREHPRWITAAKERFALACKKACETRKAPRQASFAKSICGP